MAGRAVTALFDSHEDAARVVDRIEAEGVPHSEIGIVSLKADGPLPPTPVERDALPRIREHLRRAAATHEPFPMVLRGTGSFRPVSDVVFVQVAEGIAECELLEREVRSGPLRRDLAFYYHPHVTVAHDLPHPNLDRASTTLADYEARFTVTSFTAYLHDGDGVWRVDHEFGLGTS